MIYRNSFWKVILVGELRRLRTLSVSEMAYCRQLENCRSVFLPHNTRRACLLLLCKGPLKFVKPNIILRHVFSDGAFYQSNAYFENVRICSIDLSSVNNE
jgi:hypothetical protein